jgi:hypothetical protein
MELRREMRNRLPGDMFIYVFLDNKLPSKWAGWQDLPNRIVPLGMPAPESDYAHK